MQSIKRSRIPVPMKMDFAEKAVFISFPLFDGGSA